MVNEFVGYILEVEEKLKGTIENQAVIQDEQIVEAIDIHKAAAFSKYMEENISEAQEIAHELATKFESENPSTLVSVLRFLHPFGRETH